MKKNPLSASRAFFACAFVVVVVVVVVVNWHSRVGSHHLVSFHYLAL